MCKEINLSWNKYGIIADITKSLQKISPQFGKTVLQKMIFLLEEVYKLNLGYNYRLYNYGPFCEELSSDLEYLSFVKGVKVQWNGAGYEISPDEKTDYFIDKAKDFIDDNRTQIDNAISCFGKMSAKDLELRATIIMFNNQGENKDSIVKKINEIKPYFKETLISRAYEKLTEDGIIV